MRIVSLLLPAACAVLLGCAASTSRTISVAPSEEELPVIVQHERTIPARVGVEGRGAAPRVLFVPTFEEPELTAEEKVALGEDVTEPIDFLEFYTPAPNKERVWSETGGVSTSVSRFRAPIVSTGPYRQPYSVWSGLAGPADARLSERDPRYGLSTLPKDPVSGRWSGTAGASVGKGPRKTISSHQRYKDP